MTIYYFNTYKIIFASLSSLLVVLSISTILGLLIRIRGLELIEEVQESIQNELMMPSLKQRKQEKTK